MKSQLGYGINASKKHLTDGKFLKYISGYLKQNKISPINVKTIIVSNNLLTLTPPIQIMTSLNTLDLSDNKIDTLTNEFTQLNSLTSLNLSHNKLIDFSLLCNMTNLKVLNLSHNRIESLPIDKFTNLTGLSELDLGWNELTEFDYEWMVPLKSIHSFSVIANKITVVKNDNGVFSKDFGTPYAQLTPNCILPHLFLGSVESTTKPFLREYHIEGVLSIGTKPLYTSKKVEYLFIQCGDSISDDVSSHFNESFEFIDRFVTAEKNVLVHCVAGVSRSASLVIAYVMKKEKIPYEAALAKVKAHRFCVCPNPAFAQQLQKYKPH
ncbi:hypothetical protein ENUP19_0284G0020 [Entamoeba nuttalli]|uniref:Leucine rich repeat and phosphatase domain containing protein n=2 Tax=Entamoeba nuttalli TaxID=412467 RepID=K2HQQ6_ENTNP|nr:leucine rich repeat and phosphatase domain containing protein [Entamoeba nuttalli P19]EKE38280.1 leucine rich repeat and phosphatase domain containing protein [Entamoeba nuttalli P19]|eukprot:XP_008859382.1 leucine rich repeat and phosphatase domain containing protein [Entamoeba nuttalli P19]